MSERWVCLVCGGERCREHDPRDRAPLSSLGPRPWHTWLEIIQPRRVCVCGADMERHDRESAVLRLKPGQYAGYPLRRCKVFCCAAAAKGAPCEGNPCTCGVKTRQLSKAKAKRAMDRFYPPKPRERFMDVVNEDGDVIYGVVPADEEEGTGWPYDTIARRAEEESDDEA